MSEIDFKTQLADRLKKRSSADNFVVENHQPQSPAPVNRQSLSPSLGRAHPPSNNASSPNFISPPASPKIGGVNNHINSNHVNNQPPQPSSHNSTPSRPPPIPERKLAPFPPNVVLGGGKSNSMGSLPINNNNIPNLNVSPPPSNSSTTNAVTTSPPPRQQSVILNSPPPININNNTAAPPASSSSSRPLPPPRNEINSMPNKSPPMPRHMPPPPQPHLQQQQSNNNVSNLPPPPPVVSVNNLPPPPPSAYHQQNVNLPPPPPASIVNMPPPPIPQSKPTANPISPNMTSSQAPPPSQLLPPRSFKMSPQHSRGGSLDSKQMAIAQGQLQQQREMGSNSSYTSTSAGSLGVGLGSLSLSGGMPPPPSLMTLPPPPPIQLRQHRNSSGASFHNPDTDRALNTMINNRLSTGLSPPIKAPFFDDKILTNNNKTAELEAKRQQEEKERLERENKKKDKKGEKEQKEKEKREKKEKEKKEKEQKKKDKHDKNSSAGAGRATPSHTIFNNTLDQVMEIQREKLRDCDNLNIPLILKCLIESIIGNEGYQTEGIFRVPGQTSEVMKFKSRINELDFSLDTTDVHVLAGLLKLWLRELTEPVIPIDFYPECIKSWNSKNQSAQILNSLPQLNRDVMLYLLNFLKTISSPIYSSKTKMDIDNIAMVFAPGLLRCPSTDSSVLMVNSQYEKDFIKNLIEFV